LISTRDHHRFLGGGGGGGEEMKKSDLEIILLLLHARPSYMFPGDLVINSGRFSG
jgi:hypothetical protein